MDIIFFFFFQAEDGIRDLYVTGVQTCALPIYDDGSPVPALWPIDQRVTRDPRARGRRRATTALPGVPRAGRRRGTVRALLVEAFLHCAALLRAARHPVPL